MKSPRTSALYRARNPEGAGWDANTYMLANVLDVLTQIRYFIGSALRVTPKLTWPKRFQRPGVLPEGVTRFTGKAVPLDELRQRLADRRKPRD